jgi:glycosyltransferase involved in cell wall biosynthesis
VYGQIARPYSVDEYLRFARRLPIHKYDVFHSPHYTLPFGIGIPSVVTIHDILHITHGERWYYPFIAKRLLSSALLRAKQVITVSATSALELQRLELAAGLRSKGALHVIPNALGSLLGQASAGYPGVSFEPQRPYFLSVISTDKPHKGLAVLIEAYQRYRLRVPNPLALVIVGAGVDRLKGTQQGEGVTVLGKVGESHYNALMAGADCLVVASSAEGFCIPFIEAHSLGIPVIYRPASALRELHVVDFDLVAADMGVAAFSEALIAASVRRELPEVAKQRVSAATAQAHSAELLAERTMGVYLNAFSQRAGAVGAKPRFIGRKSRAESAEAIPEPVQKRQRALIRSVAAKFSQVRKQRASARSIEAKKRGQS